MNDSRHVPVKTVMTPTPHIIDGLATVREALDLMREHQVSSIVIDRRDDHDEYGILVVHDIANKIIGDDKSPDRTNVYEIMSKPVLKLDQDMDIKYAARMLTRFRLSRALVTDSGSLVGIVTLRDLVLRYVPSSSD